jgi:predicted alpha/beta hydrolase
MSEAAAPQPVTLTAQDGRHLSGLLLMSASPRGALSINGATGFRREFYLKFARYCAARGYHTLVYDYRGMGSSATVALQTDSACMSDWGRLDMPAALDYLSGRFAPLPLIVLGHSVGGQLIGCMPNHCKARALVLIAVSTGYWRRQHAPFRYQALIFWKIYGPLMLRRLGYVPRGVAWAGDSLPPEVFRQWRRWCLSAAPLGAALDPALTDEGFAGVRAPLLSLSFTDDPIATRAAVEALLCSYPNAQIERRWTSARQAGGRRIGHHGFFTESYRDSLWPQVLDWVDARSASAS